MADDRINDSGMFSGFNAGCVDPQAYMSKLLAGDHPDYGVDKELDACIPVANVSVQDLGIPKLSDNVANLHDRVIPRLLETNSRTVTPFTVVLSALGAGTITFSAFIFRFFAFFLSYQISSLAGVLSSLSVTRNGVDGASVPPAQGNVTWNVALNCPNSTQGSQALFFERRLPLNQAGTALSCNDQNVGICQAGETTGTPPIVAVENVVFAGTPGATITVETIGPQSRCIQDAKRGTSDVFAKLAYKKIARLIANDMKRAQA